MNIRQCDAYAGIGARITPPGVCVEMTNLAECLAVCGWTLRSGGAAGADTAFELGAGSRKEIFLPFQGFNENESELFTPPAKAYDLAAEYHPTFKQLKPKVKAFHARNMQQIFGENLDCAVQFVVCWTPDGCEHDDERTEHTGGTGQAISAASLNNIPVYNIAKPGRLKEVKEYCDCKMTQYSDYV